MNCNESIKKNSTIVWGASPAGCTLETEYQKGTKEFFDSVVQKRLSTEFPWLEEIAEFQHFKNKKILEIGCGAGYDAFMFCNNGAAYTGIDITPENQLLTKKHLAFYGYTPNIQCMDVEQMDFVEEFDFAFSFGVLHHTPHIEKAVSNIYRSLKKGGHAEIIIYHKHSAFYLLNTLLTEWIIKSGFLQRTLAQERSRIEFNESSAEPLVNVYSKREIKNMLQNAGFSISAVRVRKLLRHDLSNVFLLNRFLFLFSDAFLAKLGNYIGWFICVRVTKH